MKILYFVFLIPQLLLFEKEGFLQESPILSGIEKEQKKLVVLWL